MVFYNYNQYVEFMRKNGFDWFDIEYYKDKPAELEKLFDIELSEAEKAEQKRNDFISRI